MIPVAKRVYNHNKNTPGHSAVEVDDLFFPIFRLCEKYVGSIKDATFAEAETLLHGHSFVQTIDSFQVIISNKKGFS